MDDLGMFDLAGGGSVLPRSFICKKCGKQEKFSMFTMITYVARAKIIENYCEQCQHEFVQAGKTETEYLKEYHVNSDWNSRTSLKRAQNEYAQNAFSRANADDFPVFSDEHAHTKVNMAETVKMQIEKNKGISYIPRTNDEDNE